MLDLILFIIFLGGRTIIMENSLQFVIDCMVPTVILKELLVMGINLHNGGKK